MTYDFEKYRDKREKVLGVKKRGLSFGALAACVSAVIIIGLGVLVIPQSVAFLQARNLDDAIYKIKDNSTWSHAIVSETRALSGVKNIVLDGGGKRMVVTYDRSNMDSKELAAFFQKQGVDSVLLNELSHSQRMAVIKKESQS